jgi:hypothetical protein
MPKVVARYPYHDEEGNLLYEVERLEPKGFRQCRKGENGERIYQLGDTRRVPYRLPELLVAKNNNEVIYIVEGEKDVETLVKTGKVATTLPGGAGKWREEYTEYFRNAQVVIITDNDETGMRHALGVANAIDPVVTKLWVVQPAEGCKDITEHLEAGKTKQDLRTFDWSSRLGPKRELEIRVISMEELMATPDVDPEDKLLDHLLIRGSRFVVGAYTGEGKTTLALQLLRTILRGDDFLGWRGLGNGTRALVIDVEQGRRTVKRRFQEAALHEYPNQVKLVWVPDGLALDSNAEHIKAIEKIMARGLAGKPWDVIIADPLYKLHQGNPNDERKAVDLMRQFDRWREMFGFALVLPMHCRKPQPGIKFSIHDISGSSAYTHGAEVIVGLQRVEKGYAHLHWWKDREGDLDCIGERWGLIYDEKGFHRDKRDMEEQPIWKRVRDALERSKSGGMTLDELRDVVDAKQATVRNALDSIGAMHDGARLVKDRRWSMPPSLFEE